MEVTIRKGVKRRLGREELRTARVLSDTPVTFHKLDLNKIENVYSMKVPVKGMKRQKRDWEKLVDKVLYLEYLNNS